MHVETLSELLMEETLFPWASSRYLSVTRSQVGMIKQGKLLGSKNSAQLKVAHFRIVRYPNRLLVWSWKCSIVNAQKQSRRMQAGYVITLIKSKQRDRIKNGIGWMIAGSE